MIHRRLISALAVSALLLSAGRLFAGVDRWTPLGPDGGAVTSLAVASGVSGLVYAGTEAGVFKSRDGGATWQPALKGLPVGDPTLFLATGGRDGRTLYAAPKSGLFASGDGGGLWMKRPSPLGTPWLVAGLAASPADPRTEGGGGLFVLTRSDR